MKQILKTVYTIILAALLTACGIATPVPTVVPTITSTPSLVPASSTPTIPPVTIMPIPTSPIPISSAPDGLRMAYIIDGNLYFQSGSTSPVQLTNSGKDIAPIFSDDGEKIVFYRGEHLDEVYSINIDGSQEQVLITSRLLMSLGTSYSESTYVHNLTFVPGTHLVLFGTQETQSDMPRWNGDLLIANTDTAEIKRLLPSENVGYFYISPDGRFIAIDTIGSIDVFDLDGNIIRQNVLIYTPSQPSFLPPGISWMPDSKGLIVLLSVPTFYDSSASGPSYTVWRYALDDGIGAQVSLDILPTEVYMATVSPDGNWIVYNNNDQYAFYIGDLRAGNTQLYEPSTFAFHYEQGWSPDSKHFVYRASRKNLFLGSINRSPELIGKGEFMGWIDANRYFYYVLSDNVIVLGEIGGEKKIIPIGLHQTYSTEAFFAFILP